MPTEIPSWRTEDGKLHTSYIAALKHELMMWFSKAGENEVGGRKIVEALDANTVEMLVAQLTEIGKQLESPTAFVVNKAS